MVACILRIACADRRGLIHAVTGVLAERGFNIVANAEFVRPETARFFMRSHIEGDIGAQDDLIDLLRTRLPNDAVIEILPPARRRMVILVSREYHCVGDLLLRAEHGELNAEIAAVISNHDRLQPLVERFEVPFHHVGHEGIEREEHERRLLALIEPLNPDTIVLAKYMRIFSPAFLSRFPERMLNIHHSSLPAFSGAHPYRQAYRRGVKIIGATAHFVTEAIDEGPIIAQDAIPVDHHDSPEGMARAGRDVEQVVLARALRLILEGRVFVEENRTIVFD